MGIVRPVVIVEIDFIDGKTTKYIMDGQHLYLACLRMNINIPYTTVTVKNYENLIHKIALLNNSSRSWNIKDYILVWSSFREDYKKLNNYFNIYDIELMQLAEILMAGTASYKLGASSYSKYIKAGTFVVNNEEYAVKILNRVTDALKIVPRMDRVSNKLFISSFILFIKAKENYNHKNFLIKLKKNKKDFNLVTADPLEFTKLLETL